MVHMVVINKEQLCKRINKAIEDELKGFIEYGELLESIPKELDSKNYDIITKIMEDEAGHAVLLKRMGLELDCPKPKLVQKLEELLKAAEQAMI